MFKNENNNMIRPRKLGWNNQNMKRNNDLGLFRIGEIQDHGEKHNVTLTLPMDNFRDSKNVRKLGPKPPSLSQKLLYQFDNYCDHSTLHGLRYVGDNTLSLGERIFWLVAFMSAIGFASYFITNIFDKWNNSPVIVSFSPFDVNLEDIPFPAVTMCNMNQVKKSEAERIMQNGTEVERKLLRDNCKSFTALANETENAPDWNAVQSFLIKAGVSCEETLKACYWNNKRFNCDLLFNNDLTDEGLCCSFNRLPPRMIFRNPNDLSILNQTYPDNLYDWTPEKGFPDRDIENRDVIPLRPAGAGTHLGLTVIADVKVHDYFCSSTDSVGFKMLISNPIETPKMADFGFLIGPGVEARYQIRPEIREATDDIRHIPISKRQCYFSNERPLRYYRSYTLRNCRQECQSNHTLNMCKCIPYFLPKSKAIKVCGKKDQNCSDIAKEDIELTYGIGSSCNCLPSCFEISYRKAGTYSKLSDAIGFRYRFDNITQDYFINNMAVMHFYFQDTKFKKTVKSEIYGFTEVLSNVGGLLGLCLGFSFLSFIEILYFLTLRVFCGCLSKKRNRTNGKKASKSTNTRTTIIPFAK